jgi:hypothetical protein
MSLLRPFETFADAVFRNRGDNARIGSFDSTRKSDSNFVGGVLITTSFGKLNASGELAG